MMLKIEPISECDKTRLHFRKDHERELEARFAAQET
jgi:hypothetical protein